PEAKFEPPTIDKSVRTERRRRELADAQRQPSFRARQIQEKAPPVTGLFSYPEAKFEPPTIDKSVRTERRRRELADAQRQPSFRARQIQEKAPPVTGLFRIRGAMGGGTLVLAPGDFRG